MSNLMSRFTIVGLALVFAMLGVLEAARAAKPNVLLIYTDDVGYGDVSCYGATRVQTPNVDRLAREGLRFTDAHCSSATCTPSRYSLLTGRYAWRKKGTGVARGDAPLIIDPDRTTLADVFQRAGYRTGVVGKWHLGLGKAPVDFNGELKPGPLELGFDYAFLMPATGDRVPCVYVENYRVVNLDPSDPIRVSFGKPIGNEPTGRDHPELLKMHPSHGHDQTIINGISRIGYMTGGKRARWKDEEMADTFVEKALAFLRSCREQNKPFFLYFCTHDIHVPRVPHPRFSGSTPMGPRGDCLVQMDWCVGRLLEALDEWGIANDTLVIFSSDNGPVVDDGYRDQSVERLGDHRPAGPWRGGKYSIFEGGTRVPFIVRWPGQVRPGVSNALVSQVDLMASLASLLEVDLASGEGPDSENVLPALLGQSRQGRDYLVEHARGIALREGSWKYIPPRRGPKVNRNVNIELGNAPQGQLYWLDQDPGEHRNLIEQYPERANAMAGKLRYFQEAPRANPAE